MLRILHAADLHLDSPFSSLSPELAAQRRRESRAMLGRMADYVKEPVRCVLFNLGWLPSGDHSVTTRVPTTLAAVEAACGLLLPGGMVSVCVYPGHEEGTRELRALAEALAGLDIREYNVLHGNFVNQRENAPQTFLIQREESLRDC